LDSRAIFGDIYIVANHRTGLMRRHQSHWQNPALRGSNHDITDISGIAVPRRVDPDYPNRAVGRE
jgi:hypothetical protein